LQRIKQVVLCTIPVPGNKSLTAKVLVFLAKSFEGTDLFVGTDLMAYGSHNELFYALDWVE